MIFNTYVSDIYRKTPGQNLLVITHYQNKCKMVSLEVSQKQHKSESVALILNAKVLVLTRIVCFHSIRIACNNPLYVRKSTFKPQMLLKLFKLKNDPVLSKGFSITQQPLSYQFLYITGQLSILIFVLY